MSWENPFKGFPVSKCWIKGDREAGLILGFTSGKIARLRRQGKIPYYLFRARYLYHIDELNEWKRLTPKARKVVFYKYKVYYV